MTNEEVCSRLYEALHLQAVQSEDEESTTEECDRGRRVRNMIARFERGLADADGADEAPAAPDEGDEFGERRRNSTVAMQPGTVNVIHAHLAQLFPVPSHGRDSSISVNSILSGISEVSFESESSGIGSETRSSGLYARSDGRTLYRRAPPPPDSPTSTASRSPLPDEDDKYHLSPVVSPVVLRRSKLPPVMRKKSIADGNQNGLEVHWSYGVKQVDLEKIIKRRKASADVHEEDEPEDETTVDESEGKDESDEGRDDETADGDDATKLDRVSVDNSVDTLINESEQCDSDQFDTSTIASDFSAERSNYDNVSIRSVSSFDMGPYIKYDSITVSSDEYGSESNIHREQDSDNSSVSAVHEWCNTRSVDPILLPSESKKEKFRRRLTERVNELLHTEAVYVDKLRHVVTDYIPEMSRPDVPSGIRGLRFEIFANIERIYRFHSAQLLPALRDCEHDLRKLGQCFRKFEQKFQMYVIYSRNNKRSNRMVFENKRFFQEKQLELGERLDLSSYLLEPVQRLPRYKLFIDDLVKTYQNYEAECEGDSRISKLSADSGGTGGSGDADSETGSETSETTLQSLTAAKAMIEALLTTVDDIIALENIRDCPLNLMNQGKLLRQNEFTVADGYKRRHLMRMFLFEKVVLFTLVYKKQLTVEIFLYFDHIPVDELGITSKDNDLNSFRIWYQRRNLKNYKLSTTDGAARTVWVQEIMALLWKQAMVKKETILKNRNNRSSMISNSSQLSETSSSNSTTATSEKYNSLRGVPGEVKRYSEKTSSSRRTTWYCE